MEGEALVFLKALALIPLQGLALLANSQVLNVFYFV